MINDEQLHMWFVTTILPLEGQLLSYLRRHGNGPHEARDLLHDVYERALLGASKGLPEHGRAYLFTIARNLLITRAKRARIVSFDLVADLDDLPLDEDMLTPERHASAREELRRALEGMERLPPRCREVVRLRKVEGLSTREVAERLDVGIDAVERQMTLGMRALTDFMLGGDGRVRRKTYGPLKRFRKGPAHD